MGLCKKKIKRCIPKEGMPHASACQKKKKMHTQRWYATCLGMSKKREKDSPLSIKKVKGEMVHTKESIHHPPKISTHFAHLDQGL